MTEEDRQRAIRFKLARMDDRRSGVLATGFAALDAALGIGGLRRGGIVEIFGPSSSGKTTLALQIAALVQSQGFTAAWIDAEHAFDATYAAALGVAIERLPVAQPDSAEEALEMARQLAASSAVDLLIVDSAAALVPRLELEAGIGSGSRAAEPRPRLRPPSTGPGCGRQRRRGGVSQSNALASGSLRRERRDHRWRAFAQTVRRYPNCTRPARRRPGALPGTEK